MENKSLSAAIVVFLASIMFFSSVVPSQSRSESEIGELERKITALQKEMRAAQEDEMALTRQLDQLEKEMVNLNRNQQQQKRLLQDIESKQVGLNAELHNLAEEDQNNRTMLLQLIRSSYMLGDQSGIKLLLNQKNPFETSRTLVFYRYFVDSKNQRIQEIRDRERKIGQITEQLKGSHEQINSILSSLANSQSRLEEKEEARKQQLNHVQKNLSKNGGQIEIYRKRKDELINLLANLQRTDIGSERTEGGQVGSNGNLLIGFGNNQGRLEMPSRAGIRHRFGDKRVESGLVWEGLMLDVQEGQRVAAIYSGQIVYADWFRGYGQLMVIDHGDGFMSLYGHNQLLHVQLGDTVSAGDVIANAGSTGGLLKPGLYFEVREHGRPVNPLKWCQL